MKCLALIADNMEPCQSRIDRWCASVQTMGYDVQQVVVPVANSVASVVDTIKANAPCDVQIFGHVPIGSVEANPDGHGVRPGDCDVPYSVLDMSPYEPDPSGAYNIPTSLWIGRVVGRIDFSGLPELGDEIALTNAWFDRNDAYRKRTFQYEYKAVINDHLDYLDVGLLPRLTTALGSAVTSKRIENHTNDYPSDQFFESFKGRSFLAGALYSGGYPDQSREYYVGNEAQFASGDVAIAVCYIFASYEWQLYWRDLQRAILVGGAQAATYGTWYPASLVQWGAKLLGPAMVAGGLSWPIVGDAFLPREIADMTQADYDALKSQIDALSPKVDANTAGLASLAKTVAALGSSPGGGTGTGGTPAPGVVVIWAHYEVVSNTSVFADVTKDVQALVNAGKPWVVGTDLKDPYYGYLKQLRVLWSNNGVERGPTLYSQWETVDPAK